MKGIVIALLAIALTMPLQAGGEREYTPVISKQPSYLNPAETAEEGRSISQILYSLGNLYAYLDRSFLDEIDTDKMETELISAMIDSLGDQYSYYIPPEDADVYAETTEGEYVGIGTYLTKMNPAFQDMSDPETYMVVIISPFPGGPADRAGLRPRDMISAINGESTAPLTAAEASDLLKGHPGDDITITVHRGSAVFDVTLQPEKVTTPSSSSGMITDDIGYIAIYAFSLTTGKSVEEEIDELIKQGADKLIIDLRNNGGGTVQSALEIADAFLSKGRILEIRYKEGSGRAESIINADSETIVPDSIPLLLLVNGGTASSSEILTGALKDNGRATVIGSQTFGKGISQEVRPFAGGYIQITTGHFYTPDGSDIHKIGITPDIVIDEPEYTDAEMKAYESFMETDALSEYIGKHPEYTKENAEEFAREYASSGVPEDLLKLLIRNEYIYSMDYDERPVADTWFDPCIRKALEVLGE